MTNSKNNNPDSKNNSLDSMLTFMAMTLSGPEKTYTAKDILHMLTVAINFYIYQKTKKNSSNTNPSNQNKNAQIQQFFNSQQTDPVKKYNQLPKKLKDFADHLIDSGEMENLIKTNLKKGPQNSPHDN